MKIVITGASGFLGRHVIKYLSGTDHDLILCARDISALERFRDIHTIVSFDIANADEQTFTTLGEPDILIHLAWGELDNFMSHKHLEIELPAHANFIEYLVTSGLKNLVVSGTCAEYGMLQGELSEQQLGVSLHAYGLSKKYLAEHVEKLHRKYDFCYTWGRVFFVYGEGQAEKTLYGQLIQAQQNGADRFPMSPGDQTRDYMEASDIAASLCKLALLQQHIGIVNICSGKPVSIVNFIQRLIEEKKMNIKLDKGVYPYPASEPKHFWGNNDRLKRLLNENG